MSAPPAYNASAQTAPPNYNPHAGEVVAVQNPAAVQPQVVYVQAAPAAQGGQPVVYQQAGTAPAQTVVYQQAATGTAQPNVVYVQQQPQQVQTVPAAQNDAADSCNANCLRTTLIVLWSIQLFGSVIMMIIGIVYLSYAADCNYYSVCYYYEAIGLGLLIPSLINAAAESYIIYGVVKENYCINIFGCVWSGLNLLGALIYVISIWYFILVLIYVGILFGLSITYTKKLERIQGRQSCQC